MAQRGSSHITSKTLAAMPSERPSSAGQPCLVIIKGDGLGNRVDLVQQIVEIGRSDECTITIDSGLISRKHAVVQRIGGKWIVADLQSTNGTYVNGQRITTHQLKDGDKISVGRTVLKYLESNMELQYHEQIMDMACRDALTSCYNKRHFDVVLKREVSDSTFHGLPLCLTIFDIDHFKRVNDTLGHPAGDVVLKQVPAIAKLVLSEGELFARVGGEEFAIIMPGCDVSAAFTKAESLRASIEAAIFKYEETVIPITVSIGVAQFAAEDTVETLYRRADERLYQSKHSGRNRVM